MANTNSAEITALAAIGAVLDPGLWEAEPRLFLGRIAYATQATSDTLTCFTWTAGVRPLMIGLLSDTTMGTATVSIGIAGTAAKYRDAAVFTVVDIMTFFRKPDTASEILAANETIIMTTAVATLPASGNLWVLGVATRH